MSSLKSKSTLTFALAFATTAGACMSSDSAQPTPAQVTSDLAQPNGGFTTADEQPEFGESAAFDALDLEADAAVTDSMSADPSVSAITASATLDAHRIMVVWGKLPADPGSTVSRDWSGQFQISTGALLVGHTVGFEPATDHLLPRSNAQTVPFDSVTRPYIDGLVLRVLEPDPSTSSSVSLTYTANSAWASGGTPATFTFDLAALEAGPVKIDAGDGFVMVAVELTERSCNQGFMRGRWEALAPNLGVYRGIVTDEVGLPVGHVKGIYGAGDLLFGKFIDHQGHFVGLIDGTYGSGDLSAKWIDRSGDRGAIAGEYFESSSETGGGFFARYSEAGCASAAGSGSGSGSGM